MSLFPGGVGVTDLRVYDWEASDGRRGGSPHMHTASSEGYVVIEGSGAVETISSAGCEEHPLAVGDVLWFTPGTVHRLINAGGLRLIAVMSNSGLPEAGDAVFTFPVEVLEDEQRYVASAALPPGGERETAARVRRDLALEGYLRLRSGGPEAFAAFQQHAVRLVAAKVPAWNALWESTVLGETEATRVQLERLARGSAEGLAEAVVERAEAADAATQYGMCGWLRTWRWPSITAQ